MLVEAAERALAHTGKKEIVMGGGVACNSRFQEMCKIMCEERGAKFFCPERQFLVNNAAMIAYLGIKMFNAGIFFKPEDFDKLDIQSRQRTDQVEVKWK
jgi:tRNA A37 threonylcarbamoyltransferase TsaD